MLKLIIILAAVAVCHVQASNRIFYLYTRGNNTPQNITIGDSGLPATFVPENKTIVLIHGHRGSVGSQFNRRIMQEIFDMRREHNIIVVDWEKEARFEYSTASTYVYTVAKDLASFLRWLAVQTSIEGRGVAEEEEISPEITTAPPTTLSPTTTPSATASPAVPLVLMEELHLVGFGLGAHIAGIASRQLTFSPGLVGRITGLDPAGSGWGSRSARLNDNDANYVEVIHTDGTGILANGIGTAIGTIDIYANGGSNQPGCFSHACSHERAWELFAASMRGHLVGYRCSSKTQMNLNLCKGNALLIGGTEVAKEARYGDIYRVNTKRSFPF